MIIVYFRIICYNFNIQLRGVVIIALIKCPECGREISDKANSCPNCGCPLADMTTSGTVRIKIPNNIATGWVGLLSSRNATIKDESGHVLWTGKHGENARFTLDHPTKIIIELGSWANPVQGMVEPKRKYSCVQDRGVHMLATFRLTEVDVIDAD